MKDDIVPSSGFTASVMEAVMREATAPPPIPFPWKRALPGLLWCLAVVISFLAMNPGHPPSAVATQAPSVLLAGLGWISAALVVSLLSVALSMRVAHR
jgi:hypothetical protein